MNEFEFDKLIDLYQKGLLTGKEKELVEAWLNEAGTEGDTVFTRYDKQLLKQRIFDQIKRSAKAPPANVPEVMMLAPAHRWSIVYKIAAAFAFIVLCTYGVIQYSRPQAGEFPMLQARSSTGVTKVILADGTLVWLKGNSTLTYPDLFSGDTRDVSLTGEALFEVAKDREHPFVITCGELTTTVLGTSFNIRSADEKIEVIVLTGKVSLTSASDKEGVIVLPNEKVVYDGSTKALAGRQQAVNDERSATVRGTEYLMAFEDSRMRDVIQRIEQKFDITISVNNPKLQNCMITADFSDQSLESTLSMISQAVGFTYDIQGKAVVLDGNGCD